jgi:hypothetical protein
MNADHDDRLDHLLHELGPAEPPPDLVSAVMARVDSLTDRGARQTSVRTNGVTLMTTRKAMWVLAAAAAVALAVFIVTGFPKVDRGTEATIGAAQRYQAQQLTTKDVVVGDTQIQEFLQSETFDRLMKDDSARRLLSNHSVRVALSNPELVSQLTNDAVRVTLLNANVLAAFADSNLLNQLSQGIADANLRLRMVNDAALSGGVVAHILADANMVAALKNQAVWSALTNADFRLTLSAGYAAVALRSPAFVNALQSPAFANAIVSHLADAQLSANIVSH